MEAFFGWILPALIVLLGYIFARTCFAPKCPRVWVFYVIASIIPVFGWVLVFLGAYILYITYEKGYWELADNKFNKFWFESE